MRITESQLRRTIRQEVRRVRLAESRDENPIAKFLLAWDDAKSGYERLVATKELLRTTGGSSPSPGWDSSYAVLRDLERLRPGIMDQVLETLEDDPSISKFDDSSYGDDSSYDLEGWKNT